MDNVYGVIFVVHIFYDKSGSCQMSSFSQAQSTLQSLAAEHRTFVAKKKVCIGQHFQIMVSLYCICLSGPVQVNLLIINR